MGSPNESTLQALTTQLDAATQTVNRMQQDETFLEAMVAQQTHELQSTDPATGASVDERRKTSSKLSPAKALEAHIHSRPSRRGRDQRARSPICGRRCARRGRAGAGSDQRRQLSRPDPPQLQQLKAQLRAAQAGHGRRQSRNRPGSNSRFAPTRPGSRPARMVEEEYKQITRDHDTALQFYNSLLNKMNESSMATALEHRQQGEQFRVMDAPNLPDAPTFPTRSCSPAADWLAGLFLGLLVAALLEYRDTSLRNERDVWAFTKLPTLAVISHIDGLPQPATPHSRWKLFSRTDKPVESALG